MHDVLPLRAANPQAKAPALPLAPSLLLRPGAFFWLWTAPLGVLLLLNLQGYWLIEGNLDPDQRRRAIWFGAAGALNLISSLTAYLSLRISRARRPLLAPPPIFWSVTAIALQVGYLWFAFESADTMLPRSVTSWIYPEEHFLFNQFAFAILPAFFGVCLLASSFPAKHLGKALALNLSFVIGAPLALYLAAHLIWAFQWNLHLGSTLIAIGVVGLGIVMFTGLVRALLLGLSLIHPLHRKGEQAVIASFALVLPFAGLILNRVIPFPDDFQAWEVYALVIANAGIFFYAAAKRHERPLLSFSLLCASFPFSLYFFIVFLPYSPLSILALLAMGAGFLVLTPIILFVLHVYLLCSARRSLAPTLNRLQVTALGIACGLALPVFFTVRTLGDKVALNAALDYLYRPTIKAGNLVYASSVTHLSRALSGHRAFKNGIYYPFLSDYYSWIVFDNLVLPDDKLAYLEETFLGVKGTTKNTDPLRQPTGFFSHPRSVRERNHLPRSAAMPQTVEITKLELRPGFSGSAKTNPITTLALELKNTGTAPAEFLKTLPLPPGVFAQGFRLSVNGQLEPGRLFEKKTALWVYTMIRDSERRDPGLLFYSRANELELRVFPVSPDRVTNVEIDFLVPESTAPLPSTRGLTDPAGVLAHLGRQVGPQVLIDDAGSVATGDLDSLALPGVERDPYLHLVIDCSEANAWKGDLPKTLRELQQDFPNARRARITFANFELIDGVRALTPIADLIAHPPSTASAGLAPAGGFALDLAVAHALREHCDLDLDVSAPDRSTPLPPQPVIVILSCSIPSATLDLPLTERWIAFGEEPALYHFGSDGKLSERQTLNSPARPLLRLGNSIRPLATGRPTSFKTTAHSPKSLDYWSAVDATWKAVPAVQFQSKETPWSRAQTLQLQEQAYAQNPGESQTNPKRLVDASRESGILLPTTSYIVVENSAQWRKLEQSEKTKLGQNAALDFLEAPAPPALYVGLGFILWFGIRQWRRINRGPDLRLVG